MFRDFCAFLEFLDKTYKFSKLSLNLRIFKVSDRHNQIASINTSCKTNSYFKFPEELS